MIFRLVANLLSISRFFIPVILFSDLIQGGLEKKYVWAVLVAASDLVDGWFARRSRGGESRLGKWLDHSSDKVTFLSFVLFFGLESIVSWYVLLPAIFSEVAVVFSSLSYVKKTGVFPVEDIGKLKMACFFLALFPVWVVIKFQISFYYDLANLLICIGTVFSFFSFLKYRSINRRV